MKKTFVVLAVVLLAVGCEKEEVKPPLSVKNNNLILFHERAEQLIVENNPGAIFYESENELIAKVSEEGIVEGNVRGKTNILVSSLDEITTVNVEVKTLINYLPEPYIGFGESYESVKGKLNKGEELVEENNGFFIQKRIDNSDIVYYYSFDDDKLEVSMFAFTTLSNITTIISDFLLERYIPVAFTGAYSAAFLSPEKDVLVILAASDDISYITVGYMKYEDEEVFNTRLISDYTLGFKDAFKKMSIKLK